MSDVRLTFLKENKRHGEVAQALLVINKGKPLKRRMKYTEAASIINGKLKGEWYDLFTDELERIIKARIKKEKRLQAKYRKQVA